MESSFTGDNSMSFVVIHKGQRSEKTVLLKNREVIPFVGASREDEDAQFGIGLLFPDSSDASMFWYSIRKRSLFQAWRAMLVLEQLKRIWRGTLSCCWTAAEREICFHDREKISCISSEFSYGAFDRFRKDLLKSVPLAEELESMLSILHGACIDINSEEIHQEIADGRLSVTLGIAKFLNEEAERVRFESALIEQKDFSFQAMKEDSPRERSGVFRFVQNLLS